MYEVNPIDRALPGRLAGVRAIITGAGSGIGRAMSLRFAAEGARVAACDVNREAVTRTIALAGANAAALTAVRFDVSDAMAVPAAIAECAHHLGGIDALCNVAGVVVRKPTLQTTEADWDYTMDINAKGVFLCSCAVLPRMVEQKSGAIINIASVAGLVGLRERAAYCASKAAVVMLTRAMALDFADNGIRVNAICPGTVDTPMVADYVHMQPDPEKTRQAFLARHPVGRLATPDDIASAAVYLASQEASYVTGVALPVDGAMIA